MKTFKDFVLVDKSANESVNESTMNLIDKFANDKNAKLLVDEATKLLMKKHNKSRQEIMDALQANDTKLVQQYAQLIATGMAALKIV